MKVVTRRPIEPKHVEERIKLAANGLQNSAIALLIGVLLAPAVNRGLDAPLWSKIVAGVLASVLEFVALGILAHIPVVKEAEP